MTQRLHILYHGMRRRMPQSSASCFSSSPCIGTGASPQSHTPTIGSAAGGRLPFRCRPQVVLPPPAPLPCLAELRFSSSFLSRCRPGRVPIWVGSSSQRSSSGPFLSSLFSRLGYWKEWCSMGPRGPRGTGHPRKAAPPSCSALRGACSWGWPSRPQ